MKQDYILCPVCGKHRFPSWEDNGVCICPHCGWEHDIADEENPFEVVGPNSMCLHDYKLRYEYYVEQKSDYHWARDRYPQIPQIEPMNCPVCGKFKFEVLSWDDVYCGVTPADVWCRDCGWHYDLKQTTFPDLKNGANTMSLNEYRVWYLEKLKENPEYSYSCEATDSYIPVPHKCPVCGKYEFEDRFCHDICPYCGWEDDGSELECEIGANDMGFIDYKTRYDRYVAANPKYKWKKNGCL